MKKFALCFASVLALAACGDVNVVDPQEMTCVDGIKNGDETGVDCGGSCSSCVIPKGDRFLGINPYPSEQGDDATVFAKSRTAGINSVAIGWSWPELEGAPGVFETTILDAANSLYAVPGFKVVLMVNPIETDWKSVPSDLEELPFDDPMLIDRFKMLLDVVFQHLPDLDIDTLLIGNEANSHLQDHPSTWGAYRTLFEAASAHAKSLRPQIKVGVEGQFEGFLSEEMKSLTQSSDIIALTYYPSRPKPGHFNFPDLSVIEGDLADVTAAYAGQEIYIIEFGYPSSTVVDSSEQEQEAFIREAFRVWDLHAVQIAMVSFFMLHDFDPDYIQDLDETLGVNEHPNYDEIFASHTTLGLRTFSGEDKLAFTALIEEAAARGWAETPAPN